MRRGDVRNLLMAALLSGPAHGYELMRRLEDESRGRWRPSPGSVYPILQLLEEQGLVRSSEDTGRRVYELTPQGRRQADRRTLRDLSQAEGPGDAQRALGEAVRQLEDAARQVGLVGTPAQVEKAEETVRRARQALYRLLAED
jgi:DNA-binding PadR family transcriptional regulator